MMNQTLFNLIYIFTKSGIRKSFKFICSKYFFYSSVCKNFRKTENKWIETYPDKKSGTILAT